MDWKEVLEIIFYILAGITTAIPLVVKLVEYVKKAAMEKNWTSLVPLITDYMQIAEKKFNTGAERKEWVMDMIASSASFVNYNIDMEVISKLIDKLCDMSKVVNTAK